MSNTTDRGEGVTAGEDVSDRRKFLTRLTVWMGAAFTAVIGLPAIAFVFAPLTRKTPHSWRAVGRPDHFAIGDTVLVQFDDDSSEPWSGVTTRSAAWIRRTDRDEFVAFAVNCTHLGCPVRWESGAELFMCPCHGGVYYQDGAVAAGPPPESLRRHRTRIHGGQVEVETRPIAIT